MFYDQLGHSIAVYPTETGAEKEVIFNSEELSSGTYYYSLELSGTKLLTKKLILIN